MLVMIAGQIWVVMLHVTIMITIMACLQRLPRTGTESMMRSTVEKLS